MRQLPLLLVLLLLSLLIAAASAQALSLPSAAAPPSALAASADDEESEADGEPEGEDDEAEAGEVGEDEAEASNESEACEAEDQEEEEFCAEVREQEEAEACGLEEASASVAVAPGGDKVRLTVRYSTFEPTAVIVVARSRGVKGGLHLGRARARFHDAGVYRDSFALGAKQIAKALAAREFDVGLRPVGAPADCALALSIRAPRRAR
jgi:hypothetical protein